MATTGRPRGRPPGSKNKSTLKREEEQKKVKELIENGLEMPFDGDAHAYLMKIYKDGTQPVDRRIDAASKAIRYEIPALQAINQQNSIDVTELTDDQLAEIDRIHKLIAESGKDTDGTETPDVSSGTTGSETRH